MKRTTVRAMVVRMLGANCAAETAWACQTAGAATDLVHINQLAEQPRLLRDYDLLVLPGGFAHGDYLGSGVLAAAELESWAGDEVRAFVAAGKLVLGICNGFQILTRLGLLPDVALAPNQGGRFECRWTYLSSDSASPCVFTRGLTDLRLPVAHGEGRLIPRPGVDLAALNAAGQLVLRYTDPAGDATAGYPWNPNGSLQNIAGVCNAQGTVFGLMPHPERATLPYHQPDWSTTKAATRELPAALGGRIFANAVSYLAEGRA